MIILKKTKQKSKLIILSVLNLIVLVGIFILLSSSKVHSESNSWINTPEGNMYSGVGGNVGIGTATPSVKLDINGVLATNYVRVHPQNSIGEGGELQLIGSGGAGNLHLDNYYGNARIHSFANGKYFELVGGSLTATGTAPNYFNSSIGIGTNTPTAKLEVRGDTKVNRISFIQTNGIDQPHGWIGAANNIGDGKNWLHIGGITDLGGDGQRRLGLFASKVFVDGSLGIGTITPQSKLDVNGDVAVNYLKIRPQTTTGEGGELQLIGSGGAGNLHLDNYYGNARIHSFSNGKHLELVGGSLAATGTAPNYFNSTLGIGTSFPQTKFEVRGGTFINPSGRTEQITSTLAIGDGDTGINWRGDGNIDLNSNGAAKIRLESNGDMCMGACN